MAPRRVAVVTDSTADFAGTTPADLQITVVPLTVNWGGDVLRDRIDITTEDFYTRLRLDRDMPKTSAPPIGIFEELYANLLSVHDSVISIHLSAKFSGTYGVAQSAARAVDEERVRVIDSGFTSVGLGWMAQRAAELADYGAEHDAISSELEQMSAGIRIYLTLESLEYLQRGGRVGRAQAFLGSVLNVKPLLEIRGGEIFPVERVRTRATAVRRLVELVEAAGPSQAVAVVHGDCFSEAVDLRQQLGQRLSMQPVPVAELGAVVAAYAGPGVLGVGCLLAHNAV